MRSSILLIRAVFAAGLAIGLLGAVPRALAQGEGDEPGEGDSMVAAPMGAGTRPGAAPGPAPAGGGPTKMDCRWGEALKGEPIAGCGVLRVLLVEAPGGVARIMFSRDDNPTLTRYMYRAKAIGSQAKLFKRMMNVTNTDLVLCPSDFQKARVLSFRAYKGKAIGSRPTCEVSQPPAAGAVPPPAMEAAAPDQPPPAASSSDASGESTSGVPGRSVTDAIERENPVRQADLVKLQRSAKMDNLARLLGFLGLLLGLGAAGGVLALALSLRKRMAALELAMRSASRPEDRG